MFHTKLLGAFEVLSAVAAAIEAEYFRWFAEEGDVFLDRLDAELLI